MTDFRHGILAGTFDPVHLGHSYIIERAVDLMDHLTIVVARNLEKEKTTYFSWVKRQEFLEECCDNLLPYEKRRNVTFDTLEQGLLVDKATRLDANFLIRGVRNVTDCAYELNIANVNHTQKPALTTLFIPSPPHLIHVSSSAVRELIINKGDLTAYLPLSVIEKLSK